MVGYQEKAVYGVGDPYGPVTRPEFVKVFLSLASEFGWQVRHVDIKGAFLYSKLNVEIYVTLPEGVKYDAGEFNDAVWLLLKALYGLKRAPRIWHEELSRILVKIGLVISKFDYTIFVCASDPLRCMLTVYVNDLLWTGYNNKLIEEALDLLKENFVAKDLGQDPKN